jgi:hypothetical protein
MWIVEFSELNKGCRMMIERTPWKLSVFGVAKIKMGSDEFLKNIA